MRSSPASVASPPSSRTRPPSTGGSASTARSRRCSSAPSAGAPASGDTDAAHASLDCAEPELSLASIAPASEELLSSTACPSSSVRRAGAARRRVRGRPRRRLAAAARRPRRLRGRGAADHRRPAPGGRFRGRVRVPSPGHRREQPTPGAGGADADARHPRRGGSASARPARSSCRSPPSSTSTCSVRVGGADTSIRGLRALFAELLSCSRAISGAD